MTTRVTRYTFNDFAINIRGHARILLSVDEAKELARQLVRETGMPLQELLTEHAGGDQASKLREIARDVSKKFNTPISKIINETHKEKVERLNGLAFTVGK